MLKPIEKPPTCIAPSTAVSSLFPEVGNFTLLFVHLVSLTFYKGSILRVWAPKHSALFPGTYQIFSKYDWFNLHMLICYYTKELPSYYSCWLPNVSFIAHSPWVQESKSLLQEDNKVWKIGLPSVTIHFLFLPHTSWATGHSIWFHNLLQDECRAPVTEALG